jgi:hypothetical protein
MLIPISSPMGKLSFRIGVTMMFGLIATMWHVSGSTIDTSSMDSWHIGFTMTLNLILGRLPRWFRSLALSFCVFINQMVDRSAQICCPVVRTDFVLAPIFLYSLSLKICINISINVQIIVESNWTRTTYISVIGESTYPLQICAN